MDSPRPKPYVWVSWITPFLAGVDKCKWKLWTKAHFRYAKVPPKPGDTFDLAGWTREHDGMVNTRATKLRESGFLVKLEEQNAFKLDGKNATLAGKPDLIAINTTAMKTALIVDEKSGKKKPQDRWQVLIYMWAKKLTDLKDYVISGEVEYRADSDPVQANELNSQVVLEISNFMSIAGQAVAPDWTPSISECNWCDILNCPKRIKSETVEANVTHF